MTKTNKSYTKRMKITRTGKLVVRKPGQNHFNSKESGAAHLRRKSTSLFVLNNKNRGRFLPNSK
ncbi:MAG TPA: hypothetical protein VFL98_03150 [Candidatus Paceibacterota bacterium]|nr:hypothetical protein [Candidatus Paceibacterota bacterium]